MVRLTLPDSIAHDDPVIMAGTFVRNLAVTVGRDTHHRAFGVADHGAACKR